MIFQLLSGKATGSESPIFYAMNLLPMEITILLIPTPLALNV